MNATDIIGYTYEADYHCVDCTIERFKEHRPALGDPMAFAADENRILYNQTDSEGNTVHPVFADAEGYIDEDGRDTGASCGDCFEYVIEPQED